MARVEMDYDYEKLENSNPTFKTFVLISSEFCNNLVVT